MIGASAAVYCFILFTLPSLYFSGMLYLHAAAFAAFSYWCVVKRSIRIPIFLLLPPVFAVAANFFLSGPDNKHLFFTWVSSYSALIAGYVAFTEISNRQLALWLCSALGVVTIMVALERFGVNWHIIIPSFKNSVDGLVTTGLDTVYSDTEGVRLRAFCGESSTLAAMLTVTSFAAVLAIQRDDQSAGATRKLIQVGIVILFLVLFIVIQTKSSLAVLLCGLMGFAIDSRPKGSISATFWIKALSGVIVLSVLIYGIVLFIPKTQKHYYQNELQNISDLATGPAPMESRSGLQSRLDFMALMCQVAVDYPFGSGYEGTLRAYHAPRLFRPNKEMDTRFPYHALGLTSFGADLVAQTGPLAALAFTGALFFALRRPIRLAPHAPIFCCFFSLLAFFWTVEAFYSLLLIPLAVRLCHLPSSYEVDPESWTAGNGFYKQRRNRYPCPKNDASIVPR